MPQATDGLSSPDRNMLVGKSLMLVVAVGLEHGVVPARVEGNDTLTATLE